MSRLHFGASRPLAYLLSALLVPLVVIAGPARPAAAATVVGVGETATGIAQTPQNTFPGGSVYCQVTGYTRLHDSGAYTIRAVVNCDWGFSYSASYEPEEMRLVAHDGANDPSGGCHFDNIGTPIVENQATETTLYATMQATTPVDPSCVLTTGQLTLSAGPTAGLPDGESVVLSFGWALGAMPEAQSSAPTTCERLSVSGRPKITHENNVYSSNSADRVLVQFAGTYGSGFSTNSVAVTVVYRRASDGSLATTNPTRIEWYQEQGDVLGAISPLSMFDGTTVPGWVGNTAAVELSSASQFVGVQIYSRNMNSIVASYPSGASQQSGQGLWSAGGSTGIHNPADCSFYFGEPIFPGYVANASAPGSTGTPTGPLGDGTAGGSAPVEPDLPSDPVSTDDGQCSGFSFTDPSSWAGAGICVLVKAIRALFNAVLDLAGTVAAIPGQIIAALGGLLADLFVPDLDLMKANFQEVQDAFADTYPGAWVQALTDFDVPAAAATGCAGPSVDVPLGEGIDFQAEPLNACDGTAAQLASLCKIILSVSVAFFGGLACIRALGSGFNWNPGGGSA